MKKNFLKITALILNCAFLGNAASAMDQPEEEETTLSNLELSGDHVTVLSKMQPGEYHLAVKAVCSADVDLDSPLPNVPLFEVLTSAGVAIATLEAFRTQEPYEALLSALAADLDASDDPEETALLACLHELVWKYEQLSQVDSWIEERKAELAATPGQNNAAIDPIQKRKQDVEVQLTLLDDDINRHNAALDNTKLRLNTAEADNNVSSAERRRLEDSVRMAERQRILPRYDATFRDVSQSFDTFLKGAKDRLTGICGLLDRRWTELYSAETLELRDVVARNDVEIRTLQELLGQKDQEIADCEAQIAHQRQAAAARQKQQLESVAAILNSVGL
ncbi:MAG: hypothetical protein LBF54_03515 [Holosporaceae bacterium]|jgi:uncharacterized protein YdaT|nr:hypothetical protein [Holosporaceae bacterium]